MARAVASACTIVVLTAFVLAGAIAGVVAAVFGSSDSSEASAAALDDIPPRYLALYRQAATLCPGLDWSILAAIGQIESDHGRSTLEGVAEGEENHAGAGGSMQFLQASFDHVVARHQIPPGGSNPPSRYNAHDAIHAAAFYLCDSGVADGDIRRAVFAYNHSDDYVDAVLAQADTYYRAAPATPGDVRLDRPPERATVPDPTSDGYITPRTHTLLRALQARGLTGNGIVCWAPRPANPSSRHPQGRACDIFFDPHDPASVAEGWQVAHWLIEHQASYGVTSIIWQGRYWSATEPRWVTYHSNAYRCPDKSNLTGCHYDHLHWDAA